MILIEEAPAVAAPSAPLVARRGLRARISGVVARVRRAWFVVGALVSIAVMTAGPASAATTTPDPATDLTGGAGDTFFTSITAYFQQHVLASVLLLFALFVGVGLLMRWGSKGAKAK